MGTRFSALALFVCGAAALFAVSCGSAKGEPSTPGDSPKQTPFEIAGAYLGEGANAAAEGNKEAALAAYEAAAKTYDDAGEVSVERADAHFMAAETAYEIGERDRALEHYGAAAEFYGRFSDVQKAKAANALSNMGVIYKMRDQPGKARDAWEKALEIYKKLPDKYRNGTSIAKIEQNIRDLDSGY